MGKEREKIIEGKSNCPFCIPRGHSFLKYYGISQFAASNYIIESGSFFVKPNILPVNDQGSHLLLIPKTHLTSLAQVEDREDEIRSILLRLRYLIGDFAIFEHGSFKEGSNNQSIYHSHAHIIGNIDGYDIIRYFEDVLNGGLNSEEIYPYKIYQGNDDILGFHRNLIGIVGENKDSCSSYLYIQQNNLCMVSFDSDNNMRSQVIQRAMGRFFGQELDWKKIINGSDYEQMMAARRIANLYRLLSFFY